VAARFTREAPPAPVSARSPASSAPESASSALAAGEPVLDSNADRRRGPTQLATMPSPYGGRRTAHRLGVSSATTPGALGCWRVCAGRVETGTPHPGPASSLPPHWRWAVGAAPARPETDPSATAARSLEERADESGCTAVDASGHDDPPPRHRPRRRALRLPHCSEASTGCPQGAARPGRGPQAEARPTSRSGTDAR